MSDFPALLRELKDLERAATPPLADMLPSDFNLTINLDDDPGESSQPIDFSADSFASSLEFLSEPYNVDSSDMYSAARVTLLNKLHALKESLYALGAHLNAKLADGSAALELASVDRESPIPTSFHFKSWRVTVAYNCFWSLIILANKIIMKLLPPFDSSHYALEAECRSISFEICKTWEDAWKNKPIGAFHTGLSFVTAYEFCTPDVQEWILKGLNALLENQLVETFRWSDDVVRMMSGKLAGEGPDLVFTQSQGAK